MLKSNEFWAIKYADGFYTGTWLTRREAMQVHFEKCAMENEDRKTFWKRRRKAYGDRAAKVQLKEIR